MRLDVPIHADVVCIDGGAGTTKALIIDPLQRRLTHIAVRGHGLADWERLVPIDLVERASEDTIWLRSTRDELRGLDNFIEAEYVDLGNSGAWLAYEWSNPWSIIVSERVPEDERALHRRSRVEATDGSVGHVEGLIVDAPDQRITHVVAQTHDFLSRQEVAVPVANVERFFTDHVFLRLARRDVESLPHVPINEAYLLPALHSADEQLVPEGPTEAGAGNGDVDAAHVEGAHLLAEEAGIRLRARGFTDEQILDWAKAFLRTEHSGGNADFLTWIATKEQTGQHAEARSSWPPHQS